MAERNQHQQHYATTNCLCVFVQKKHQIDCIHKPIASTGCFLQSFTLPETSSSPHENQWLEDEACPFGARPSFGGFGRVLFL